jgi:hypothetical protein
MNAPAKPPRNLWPIGIIAVCSVFVAGTAGLIVMACSQKVELVSPDYYEKELKFQGQIDRAERTRRDASQATVAFDVGRQCITVSLPPGQAASEVAGTIELYRPAAAGMDHAVKLAPDASGVQRLDARAMAPGLWRVRVNWTANQQGYYLEQKVVVGARAS